MATTATDPLLSLPLGTTSSDIFSSPTLLQFRTLPQIRALHKSLHAQIDDKAARLRVQVGGSYRELLGTADTIVQMKSDMEVVQHTLGDMGGRCGRGIVSGKSKGLEKFLEGREKESQKGEEGRRRLLEGCGLGLEGVVRGGDKLVLAARLYVLGRLLVKSLENGKGDSKKVKGLDRNKLMRCIDAVLKSGKDKGMRHGDVLKALSAYSLVTGSGARDVLRHFLSVRGEAIALALDVDEEECNKRDPKDVVRALGLYTKTLQDVQALVPNKLTEALMGLKRDRLLEDEGLQKMEGLRLDVYKRWCGDEIQFYTPFIRHDDLDGKTAREMLTSWAKKGSEILLEGMEKTLDDMAEFKAVVELRTNLLKLWISEGGKARGFDSSIILDQIRGAINKHLLRILEVKVAKLRLVGSEVSAAVNSWREGTTDKHESLWHLNSLDTDLSNGAAQFAQDAVSRLYGRNAAVSKAVSSYKSWFQVIDDVGTVVDQLKKQRWENDIDEIEDEETIEERQQLLSKDDPRTLSEHLNSSLIEAFKKLSDHLSTIWEERKDGPNKGAIAMYLLRLLRDIRSRLPDIEAAKAFGLSDVPSLHNAMVSTVAIAPLDEFATAALVRKTVVGRGLWEGEPELPVSPSPGAFKFLRNLSIAMGDAGDDLWSPMAVKALKGCIREQLSEIWLEKDTNAAENEATDGEKLAEEEEEEEEEGKDEVTTEVKPKDKDETKDEEPVEQHKDLLTQWLFDVYYLEAFLGSTSSSLEEDKFKKLGETIRNSAGLDSSTAKGQLTKASQEYSKRTGLLFGLLI
ncbi:oligomeric Golgi complex subunit 1 [Cladorrhinum samala]|uniref:Conserved oligomeric Golgi complex subunit 1 n=1 Tax=Cladorrhinum samala TaxID=585594 RepID=A0AAV9HPQ0_9PEZI|nr:oligomeric Golgi complex subunit 1 [Cladorrhinum samala]